MLPAPSTADTELSLRSAPLVVLPAAEDALDRFRVEVTRQQVREWLPRQPELLLDLSPSCPRLLDLMIERGHTVVHAVPEPERLGALPARPGRLHRLQADGRSLEWVTDGSVDGVVAEGGCLSTAPAAELTLEHIFRVLRPGGRLLLSVNSLVAGLARLADQGRWAELADVPAADVVLVPDGESVTRCFSPDELHTMLAEAGFDVEWIRPRTVLADETVSHALTADPGKLQSLVELEMSLARSREGDAIGARLVASALRP